MAAIIHIQREATSRDREGKKRLHHVEVHPGKNGGWTVEHHYSEDGGMMFHEPDLYAFSNAKEALQHLSSHMAGAREPLTEEFKPTEQAEED